MGPRVNGPSLHSVKVHRGLGSWNSARGVKGAVRDLTWQPRSCHVSTRADVALRWQPRWHATSASGRRRLGVELVGERRHGDGRRGHREQEGVVRKLGLTSVARRREGSAGSEVKSGGAVGAPAAMALRWLSGRGDVRTV